MDEHLTFNKNAKELAKAASRALGSLITKVNIAGGMTYKVYNKLYTSMIEPILMYGSGVWGTRTFSVISSVQNRACKYFLSVGKHTSNVSSRGDMGWTSCYTKQRINVCRLLCRTLRNVRKTIDFLIKFTSGFQEGEKVGRLKWTRLLTR